MQNENILWPDERLNRRPLLLLLVSSGLFPALPSSAKTKSKNPYDERRLLEQNKRIQRENNAPEEFPNFIREGYVRRLAIIISYYMIVLEQTNLSEAFSMLPFHLPVYFRF